RRPRQGDRDEDARPRADPRRAGHPEPAQPSVAILEISRKVGPWKIERAAEKLRLRAELPGACAYDHAAAALSRARAAGIPARELLPAALPASWLVNARVPSETFQ